MLGRIEVAVRPDFVDSAANAILRRIELTQSDLRRKIRWARMLDVYWIDLPVAREELISGVAEICWDRVLQWLFTGNLIPSAAGKTGGLVDLMEHSPNRPGKFWGIERRFRPGVTDNVGRSLLEAFEISLVKKIPQGRAASGGLLVLEGAELTEEDVASIARNVFCNELIQTWTVVPEESLKKNDRFHQERLKYDLPRVNLRGTDQVDTYPLGQLGEEELAQLSKKKLWALSVQEMNAIRDYYTRETEMNQRSSSGLSDPTDVELEILAQTWSEHCKHKIFNAKVSYAGAEASEAIPAEIDGLFKTTIAGTTSQLNRPWLLSVFHDNAGICAFDDDDAFCIKVETHNSPSALDPYGGALTGIVGVNRDILGCGLGAKPIFNTDVFCVAPPAYDQPLPDRLLSPRRILDGIRRGVEHGGNKSGIPTVNGALVFDDRYLGKPLVYCGTAGLMPRRSAGEPCESKRVVPGDRICMVGGRIGKDGIHGATFSSLALDDASPTSAVQLGDPIIQKRMSDFLLEARDSGLYRAITDNGAGGLSSSVGEMAKLSGGAQLDVSLAKTKYPGLKPFELMISESQERMTVAVAPGKLAAFLELAERRGVEVSDLGEFNQSGRLEVLYAGKTVANLDLEFLHGGAPRLELKAEWTSPNIPSAGQQNDSEAKLSFVKRGGFALVNLLGSPNIASKEWMIRQYDHEVQGTSVIKPLHTFNTGTPKAWSGPNDAGVVKPKPSSDQGLAVGSGILPKLSDVDPYLMAQASVDEAVRNVLCVGAEYGSQDSVLALVDNFCWPDPTQDPKKMGWLVRACYGLRDAALALGIPLVSGKDSMKNDFHGKRKGEPVSISVVPTLLMTAVARVPDIKFCRTSDFKSPGDCIYLLGGFEFGLVGSEFQQMIERQKDSGWTREVGEAVPWKVGMPAWEVAKRVYNWVGGTVGRQQSKLRSMHDVSEGGVGVAIAEGLIARGLGAQIRLPADQSPWEFFFGEGFHSFVVSVPEESASAVELEWDELNVPYRRIGTVSSRESLDVTLSTDSMSADSATSFSVSVKQIRSAWIKEGFWE